MKVDGVHTYDVQEWEREFRDLYKVLLTDCSLGEGEEAGAGKKFDPRCCAELACVSVGA